MAYIRTIDSKNMKKYFAFLTLFLALLTFAKADINFNHGPWKEILAQAAKENKIVFVDAYTSWCGPCKWMAANTFTNTEVADYYNAHFINAKIDMEKGEGPGIAEQYHVNAYPTLLFVNANGELVHAAVGALNPEQFLELGKNLLDPNFMTLPMMQDKFAKGERGHKFMVTYLNALQEANEDFVLPLEEFRKGITGNALLENENWTIFKSMINEVDAPESQYFLGHLQDFSARYGADDVNEKALMLYTMPMVNAMYGSDENIGDVSADYAAARKALVASGIDGALARAYEVDIERCNSLRDWDEALTSVDEYVAKVAAPDANLLNTVAWGFFENVEKDKMLKSALVWATKACDINPIYAYLDTKAMLQMKLGLKKDAIASAESAIAKAKETGEDYSATEKELRKMKKK